LGKSK